MWSPFVEYCTKKSSFEVRTQHLPTSRTTPASRPSKPASQATRGVHLLHTPPTFCPRRAPQRTDAPVTYLSRGLALRADGTRASTQIAHDAFTALQYACSSVTMRCDAMRCDAMPCDAMRCHAIPHHITSHHITSHHITSHHTIPHCSLQNIKQYTTIAGSVGRAQGSYDMIHNNVVPTSYHTVEIHYRLVFPLVSKPCLSGSTKIPAFIIARACSERRLKQSVGH